MPTMTFTPAQTKVMKTLDKAGKPLSTSNKTTRKTVSGASAAVLTRHGLVRRNKANQIELTAKGKKALAKAV